METENTLYQALKVELVALAAIFFMLYFLTPERSSYFRLYELLGGTSALILTTFGLYKMKKLT